jgi:hypothetical protein
VSLPKREYDNVVACGAIAFRAIYMFHGLIKLGG